jgi:hypothetical protein
MRNQSTVIARHAARNDGSDTPCFPAVWDCIGILRERQHARFPLVRVSIAVIGRVHRDGKPAAGAHPPIPVLHCVFFRMMLPPATTCHDIPEVSVALFGGVFVSAIVSSFLEWLKSRMSQIFRHSPSFAGSAGIYFLRKCYDSSEYSHQCGGPASTSRVDAGLSFGCICFGLRRCRKGGSAPLRQRQATLA